MFAASKYFSRKMIGLIYTDVYNVNRTQQPCCVCNGIPSSLRTMSMFMQ
jgi:hypothetical protein